MSTIKTLVVLGAMTAGGTGYAGVEQDILGRWTTGLWTDSTGYFQYRVSWFFEGDRCRQEIDGLINHPMGKGGSRDTLVCNYKIGQPSATVPGAYEIDVHHTAFLKTALHPDQVTDWNEKQYCGFDNWQIGVPRDITNLQCDEGDQTEPFDTYTIVKVLPNESFQLGVLPEDGSIGSTPDTRSTELDPEQIIPRNGRGGTDPDPADDILTSSYEVTGFRRNANGCDDAGLATSRAPFPFFEIYTNGSIIPATAGWSMEPCDTLGACRDEPNRMTFFSEFPIHEEDGQGRYKGNAFELSWSGQCNVRMIEGNTVRSADGSLRIESKTYRGVSQVTHEECSSRNTDLIRQRGNFSCVELKVLEAKRVSQ